MTASHRISHGFHRLGLVLAALTLIATVLVMGVTAITAYEDYRKHERLVCAHDYFRMHDLRALPQDPILRLNLHSFGCSDDPKESARAVDIDADSPPFDWQSALVWPLVRIAAAGLAGALMLYGAVRAIGWVVGGFAAS